MKNAYITGYRNYELGLFSDDDPKVKGLRYFLRKREIELLDEGYDWFLFGGQLGVEYYAFDEALKLKHDYPELQLAVMFPFENFGEQWSEKNQMALQHYHQAADFVGCVSKRPYTSPEQLRQHQQFLLQSTKAALVVYDDEVPGKSRYFIRDAEQYAQHHDYQLMRYDLYDLQESFYSYMEENQEFLKE